MRYGWYVGLLLACGCGGSTALATGADSGIMYEHPGDATSDAFAIGVGPIDASGAPSELVLTCAGAVGPVALSLPCKVGEALPGGGAQSIYNVTECDLAGPQDNMPPHIPAISLTIPLGEIPTHLNQPFPIGVLPTEPPGFGSLPGYPGEKFSGSLKGDAVFVEVDPVGRAFVGRLQQATVAFGGDKGDSFSCTVSDGAFWAVAGAFL